MFVKSGATAQKGNNQELSRKNSTGKARIQSVVNIGDQMKCPECETLGRVVWISQDKKTMGIKCHASHREVAKPQSRYGARVIPSTKNRKDIVFLASIN